MHSYEAMFGHTWCSVDVEAKAGKVNGGTAYGATPYELNEARLELCGFKNTTGHTVELLHSTEAGALERAATFLERRFGPSLGPLRLASDRRSPLRILPPRERGSALSVR
jgi:hypothetical protein